MAHSAHPLLKAAISRLRFGRKGDGTMEALLSMTMAVAVILAAAPASRILTDMLKTLNANSAEAVARDLAGIVTVESGAQDEITVTYQASPDITYDVKFEGRVVNISNVRSNGEIIVGSQSILNTGWGKAAVDPIGDFQNVNVFTMTKRRAPDCDMTKVCNRYDVSALYDGG